MNKTISLMFLSLMLISMLGIVSASDAVFEQTLIAGKIYNADFSDTIEEASVTIDCSGNIQSSTSLSDGAYSVTYDGEACNEGSSLTVSAVKGSLYGSETGIIHDKALAGTWDLAVVNVPLVPEFGIIIGALTILSAMGIFFVVRRN